MDRTSDKLMEDLRAVMSDAEVLLNATAGQAGEQAEQARARVEESLRAARAHLEGLGSRLDEQVRANPWTAVGVAAGVGLLVGLLLSRK